jgi:hypothetical protein
MRFRHSAHILSVTHYIYSEYELTLAKTPTSGLQHSECRPHSQNRDALRDNSNRQSALPCPRWSFRGRRHQPYSYLRLALAMMVSANFWLPSSRSRSLEPLRQTGGNKKACPITICIDGARRPTREKPFAWPLVLLQSSSYPFSKRQVPAGVAGFYGFFS